MKLGPIACSARQALAGPQRAQLRTAAAPEMEPPCQKTRAAGDALQRKRRVVSRQDGRDGQQPKKMPAGPQRPVHAVLVPVPRNNESLFRHGRG
jgi:hypothetical protein